MVRYYFPLLSAFMFDWTTSPAAVNPTYISISHFNWKSAQPTHWNIEIRKKYTNMVRFSRGNKNIYLHTIKTKTFFCFKPSFETVILGWVMCNLCFCILISQEPLEKEIGESLLISTKKRTSYALCSLVQRKSANITVTTLW